VVLSSVRGNPQRRPAEEPLFSSLQLTQNVCDTFPARQVHPAVTGDHDATNGTRRAAPDAVVLRLLLAVAPARRTAVAAVERTRSSAATLWRSVAPRQYASGHCY
jgi:hypothetical protein